MGFEPVDFRFLLSSERLGFTGGRICTLGRQTLYGQQEEFTQLLQEYGKLQFLLPEHRAAYFVEDILDPLGFKVDSIDVSDYEGANILHDLNHPIPESMYGRYDLVYDAGTLEHIYNFPVAMQSAMRMIKIGGHIMLHTPANNMCGHGFYQFSPELFFRILSPENGFELVRFYLTGPGGPYHVADPASLRERVTLLDSEVAMLMVHAKKTADIPISSPQQSDYIAAWMKYNSRKHDGPIKTGFRRVRSVRQIAQISKMLKELRPHRADARWNRNSELSNRRFYVPVTDWTIPSTEAFPYRT